MDSTVIATLAAQAGFDPDEQAALQSRLSLFAGLVLALRDQNQKVQTRRLLEFSETYSLEEIRDLADSGELENYLPTFEVLPEDKSPINFADLKPIDFRKGD